MSQIDEEILLIVFVLLVLSVHHVDVLILEIIEEWSEVRTTVVKLLLDHLRLLLGNVAGFSSRLLASASFSCIRLDLLHRLLEDVEELCQEMSAIGCNQ